MRASLAFLGAAILAGMITRAFQGFAVWGFSIPLEVILTSFGVSLIVCSILALISWPGFLVVLACRKLQKKSAIPGRPFVLSTLAPVVPSVLWHFGGLIRASAFLQVRMRLGTPSLEVATIILVTVASAVSTAITFTLGQRYASTR